MFSSSQIFSSSHLCAAIACGEANKVDLVAFDEKGEIKKHSFVKVGNHPRSLALDQKRHVLFVSNSYDNTISVVDLKRKEVMHTIITDEMPWSIKLSRDNKHLAVTHTTTNTVSLINVENLEHCFSIANIPVGKLPWMCTFSPDNHHLIVTNYDDNSVSVIDIALKKVVQTLRVGKQPRCVKADVARKRVYVLCYGSDHIDILQKDHGNLYFISDPPVAVNHKPMDMILMENDEGNFAFINHKSGFLSRMCLDSYAVNKEYIPNCDHASGIAVDREKQWILLTKMDADSLVFIDMSRNNLLKVLTKTHEGPKGVLFYQDPKHMEMIP